MQRIDSEFLSEVVKVWMSLNTLQSINFISKLIVLNKKSRNSGQADMLVDFGYFLKDFSSKA